MSSFVIIHQQAITHWQNPYGEVSDAYVLALGHAQVIEDGRLVVRLLAVNYTRMHEECIFLLGIPLFGYLGHVSSNDCIVDCSGSHLNGHCVIDNHSCLFQSSCCFVFVTLWVDKTIQTIIHAQIKTSMSSFCKQDSKGFSGSRLEIQLNAGRLYEILMMVILSCYGYTSSCRRLLNTFCCWRPQSTFWCFELR